MKKKKNQGDRQEVGGVVDPLSRLVMDMTAARFMRLFWCLSVGSSRSSLGEISR